MVEDQGKLCFHCAGMHALTLFVNQKQTCLSRYITFYDFVHFSMATIFPIFPSLIKRLAYL